MLPIREFQTKLLRQRQSLRGVRAHLEEDLLSLETDAESELVERAQDETFIRLLARLDDCQKTEIEGIDRALGKIANGDYGRCEACGKPIPLSRLEALPMAASRLPCTEARERLPFGPSYLRGGRPLLPTACPISGFHIWRSRILGLPRPSPPSFIAASIRQRRQR